MTFDKVPVTGRPEDPRVRGGEGCVGAVVRVPVRVVAFAVVLPLKLLWDGAAWLVRALGRYVLYPPLRALGRLLAAIWRYVVAPLGRWLVVAPAVWLRRHVLHPVLRGISLAVRFLCRWLVVRPAAALWRYVLRWVFLGLGWLLGHLVVVPSVFLWRSVVVPVCWEVGRAVAAAWRVGACVSRAVGRGVGWFFRVLVFRPLAFLWRCTGAPVFRAVGAVLRFVRREVLHPVRVALADARRAVASALFGSPR